MQPTLLLLMTAVATLSSPALAANSRRELRKEYCVVGAGPSGLQFAYFLQKSSRQYVVLERSHSAGAFFIKYPRHRRLISINKRWADSFNTEYLLRHDWNSLLSDDERLQFRHYSDEMFPHTDIMVRYLQDFQRLTNISVHFNTSVLSVTKPKINGDFVVEANNGINYKCGAVIMATGLPKLREMNFRGSEFTVGYDKVSTNRSDFEGKRVLIIGKGNAGFEIARHIYGSTQLVHLVGRHPVRFAWSTHYVGDLRAINNELLDSYQLKSLDGMFETGKIALIKNSKGEICLQPPDGKAPRGSSSKFEFSDAQSQYCYEVVVRASGFVFDSGPLQKLNLTTVMKGKYPRIANQFESADVKNLFFVGTNAHSLDFRKAAGGFIHGFRYNARALFRYLSFRRHRQAWPSRTGPVSQLLDTLVKRINEGSGNYQMFSFLGDVVILSKDRSSFTLLEEVPVKLLHLLPRVTGHEVSGDVLVFQFEYGKNFSGPRMDTFNENRAGCDIANAHLCNFLRPVIYHYAKLPTNQQMFDPELANLHVNLPKPDSMIHLMEDFFTSFRQENHIMPLVSFLEKVLHRPLAPMSQEFCARSALLHGSVPAACQDSLNSWSLAEMMAS